MNSTLIYGIATAFIAIGFGVVFTLYFQDEFVEVEPHTLHPTSATVGIARWIDDSEYDKNIAGFKIALSEHGFQEGKNLEIITKSAKGDKSRQSAIIKDFVDSDVDLIYSLTTPGTLISKSESQVPIVFSIVTFPVEAGILDDSESRIIKGTSNYISIEEQLEHFLRIVPISKLGFVNSGEVNSSIFYEKMREHGKTVGVEVVDLQIPSKAISKEFLERSIDSVDAFYQACDTVIQDGVEEIAIDVAFAVGKPTFTCNKEGVYYGAIIGTVADFQSLGELSGLQAAGILGDDDIETSSLIFGEDYYLVNTNAAEALGIQIPQSILDESDEIVDWRI